MPVYKDEKTNSWYSKFRYKDWNGTSKDKTKRGFATKKDALQWENEFKARQAGDMSMTFASFAELYMEERFPRLKKTTQEMKRNIIETKIIPYFGNMKINEISSTDVVKWQNILLNTIKPNTKKEYSKSYLKTVHNQLNAILNYACRHYKLNDNPASKVGNIGNDKQVEMNFWTLDEYRLFADEIMEEPIYYYAFQVLYWLGLREGEMLALTKEDFDFKNKTVRVHKNYQVVKGEEMIITPKTRKGTRTIAIPEFLCEELSEYFAKTPYVKSKDRIFETVNKNSLARRIDKVSKKVGIKRIRVHDLRHSHVSLLIDMNYSAVAIANRMGHESIHITYRYAHMFPTVQESMASDLNKLVEGDN